MKDEADYRNSDVIRDHMTKNIFPVIAYYMALLEYGISTSDACVNTFEEKQKHVMILKIKNEKFSKIPFSYYVCKLCCKNFLDEEWEKE